MREGRDIVKMRWWCLRKRKQDWSGNKIAAHLQIPRSTAYYWIYNYKRPHQSLDYQFPAEVYFRDLKDKSSN